MKPMKIKEGVYVFQSDLWMINSGLILNDLGSLVIDPAFYPEEIQDIKGFMKSKNCQAGYCIFTHSDFDHVVGYQHFAGARTIGSTPFLECDKKEQVQQLVETDLAQDVRREEFFFPKLDIAFDNALKMPIKTDQLSLFEAPGHTEDSIFIICENKGIIFSGDTLSDMEFPFIYFNSGSYRKTLDLARIMLDKYDLQTLVPGHGTVATDRKQIISRIETDIEYIDTLVSRTKELHQQGLWQREIVSVMLEFSYANEPIDGGMLKMHLDNVKQVLSELKVVKI